MTCGTLISASPSTNHYENSYDPANINTATDFMGVASSMYPGYTELAGHIWWEQVNVMPADTYCHNPNQFTSAPNSGILNYIDKIVLQEIDDTGAWVSDKFTYIFGG